MFSFRLYLFLNTSFYPSCKSLSFYISYDPFIMSYKALCNYVLKSVSKNFKSCLPPVRGQVPAKAEKTIITTKSRTSADEYHGFFSSTKMHFSIGCSTADIHI